MYNIDFIKIDNNIKTKYSNKLKINNSIDPTIRENTGINTDLYLENVMKSEVQKIISNYYRTESLDKSNNLFLKINKDKTEFISIINSNNYNNIICNSRLSFLFSDLREFSNIVTTGEVSNSPIYPIGKIGNKIVYVDAYQSFKSDFIILINDIYMNIEVIPKKTNEFIEYNIKIGADKIDSVNLYVIEGENSPSYNKYVQYVRGININKILN